MIFKKFLFKTYMKMHVDKRKQSGEKKKTSSGVDFESV